MVRWKSTTVQSPPRVIESLWWRARVHTRFVDGRSYANNELVPGDLVYSDKVGEVYGVCHHPRHTWYYHPRQTPDEALPLKIYDSQDSGVARRTAHPAFDDPSSSPDAAPRRSIELRALLFFAPAAVIAH